MTIADPEIERKRLAALYAAMNDSELERLAAEPDALTQAAVSSLTAEMSRRGLSAETRIPSRENAQIEPGALVTIWAFQDHHFASLANSMLESAGIEGLLVGYSVGHVGRFQLQVKQEDVEAANEILNQPIPESFEVEGVGEFRQPRCPACGSLDVCFEGWPQPMSDTLVRTRLLESEQDFWKCAACSHVWPAAKVEA